MPSQCCLKAALWPRWQGTLALSVTLQSQSRAWELQEPDDNSAWEKHLRGRVGASREELGEPLSGGGTCHIVLTLRPEKESGFSSTCLPLSCRRVTSKGPTGTGSRVTSHSCTGCLLYNSGDAFHVEQRLWSHSGCNPHMLAWQPCQGEEASVSLEGNASFRACSSEGQPRQSPGYNPLSSGSPHWHLASNGHGQPVFKFFREKTCGFDLG